MVFHKKMLSLKFHKIIQHIHLIIILTLLSLFLMNNFIVFIYILHIFLSLIINHLEITEDKNLNEQFILVYKLPNFISIFFLCYLIRIFIRICEYIILIENCKINNYGIMMILKKKMVA